MIIRAIAINELRRFFLGPLAWIILAVILFFHTFIFFTLTDQYQQGDPSFVNHGITITVVAVTLQSAGLLLLLVTPFLTMRLISEERRSGTLTLLLSSPVTITEIIFGKYLGLMTFFLGTLILISLMPLSLSLGTSLDMGLLASGMFGLLLLVSAFASIGLFASTLTKQPAIAAVLTFGIIFLLWIFQILANTGNETLDRIILYLSMQRHFNHLLSGIISSIDVFYYLLVIMVFLALSILRLDALRRMD